MTNEEKIQRMREGGALTSRILGEVLDAVKPGVKTIELDRLAEKLCTDNGVIPAFKGYHRYPATICIGPEDVVVHGIPGERVLKEGEIVSIDFGIIFRDVFLDMARTVPVGKILPDTQHFIDTVEQAMYAGCQQALSGNHVGDIGHAISDIVEKEGYVAVRELVGHGVGRHLHEEPMIPGFGKKGRGEKLFDGQTLAVEAIINQGTPDIEISEEDGWTSRTKDGMLSALFENTVLVSDESEILTPL